MHWSPFLRGIRINGQLAGESRCGYAMFRVPLNPYLNTGENLISVAVDNRHLADVFPLMADFTFYGGLYREVKLLVIEDVHFVVEDLSRDGVYLTPKKIDNDSFELEIRGTLVNKSFNKVKGMIQVQLLDQEGNIALETLTGIEVEDTQPFMIVDTVRNPILWVGVDNPYLYKAYISVTIEGQIYDLRHVEIGFRTVEVTSDQGVLLNGKQLKLKGVSRHQDYAGVGNAVTREQMEEDLAIIRDMGANSIRLVHYQYDDYIYKLCDKSGMLVWAEIPFISTPFSEDPENINAKEQLERLIKQAYNHCSIYCWGVQNEITIAVKNEQTYETIKQLHAIHKESNDILIMSNLSCLKVYNNNVLLDEIKTVEPVNLLQAVTLTLGENQIRVEGIDGNGNVYTDEMSLHYVTEIDKSYTIVAQEQNNHVLNWFEKFDLSNVQKVNLRDGYYSTLDTIEELCRNDDAKVVFVKYFGDMADNPRFAPMKAVMSIEKISKISSLKIPIELLSIINKDLNVIKK